jgi:hypothetical protein
MAQVGFFSFDFTTLENTKPLGRSSAGFELGHVDFSIFGAVRTARVRNRTKLNFKNTLSRQILQFFLS